MATRVVEGKKPYTGGKAISIDENKVISLNLRDENNLIIYDAGDDEIYVDLQLDDEITPTSAFPIGVNVGRVIVDNGWDKPGTIISAETTSGDNIKIFYADEGTLWIDNGTGTFKQIYFKADVDALLLALRNYIDGELAKKQNGVSSDTAPSNPSEGDLWYDTTNNELKVYDGSQWAECGGGIPNNTDGTTSTVSNIWVGTNTEYGLITPVEGQVSIVYRDEGGEWQPNPTRTILYYEFENNLNDSSGNGHTIVNSSYIGYEQVGGQYTSYITSGAGYLRIDPSWTSSIGGGNFAISFWLYPKQPPSSNYPMVLGIFANASPFEGPTIFFDPYDKNGHGDSIFFRMIGGGNEHPANVTASSLYDSRHHIVMTRNSGTVNCYIDNQLATSWNNDYVNFPTSNYSGYILYSNNGTNQQRGVSGVKGDKFIIENVGWTARNVSNYYDQTKGDYGIS